MDHLQIAPDREHFLRDDQPFFWAGDTVWSAFTNPSLEEWEEYLLFRENQGFNVLQINTLPKLAIPLLSKIPFIGPIFFNQNILTYFAYLLIPLSIFVIKSVPMPFQS